MEIHLGSRYLDIHLHWGEGVSRSPWQGEGRGTRGRPQELPSSSKGPLNSAQFSNGHSSRLSMGSFLNLCHSDPQHCSVPCPVSLQGYHSPPWGDHGREGLMVDPGGRPPSPQLGLHLPHSHPLNPWAVLGVLQVRIEDRQEDGFFINEGGATRPELPWTIMRLRERRKERRKAGAGRKEEERRKGRGELTPLRLEEPNTPQLARVCKIEPF